LQSANLVTEPVSLKRALTDCDQSFTLLGIALVRKLFALISNAVPLISNAVPLISNTVALVGNNLPSIGHYRWLGFLGSRLLHVERTCGDSPGQIAGPPPDGPGPPRTSASRT
jgi:hypothetical protein